MGLKAASQKMMRNLSSRVRDPGWGSGAGAIRQGVGENHVHQTEGLLLPASCPGRCQQPSLLGHLPSRLPAPGMCWEMAWEWPSIPHLTASSSHLNGGQVSRPLFLSSLSAPTATSRGTDSGLSLSSIDGSATPEHFCKPASLFSVTQSRAALCHGLNLLLYLRPGRCHQARFPPLAYLMGCLERILAVLGGMHDGIKGACSDSISWVLHLFFKWGLCTLEGVKPVPF